MTSSRPNSPSHARRTLVWVALAILVGSSPAVAFGPADALQRSPGPRVEEALERVRSADRDLADAISGISARFRAAPTLTYGADVEDPAALGASIDLDVALDYRYDAPAILSERIDLERARIALQDARRWEGKEALELFGALARARLAVATAEAEVAIAKTALEAARADGDAADGDAADENGSDAVELAYLELDLREAELDADHERAELVELERAWLELGLGAFAPQSESDAGPTLAGRPDSGGLSAFAHATSFLPFQPVRFATPSAHAQDTPHYRLLALQRDLAALEVERLRTFGVLQAIDLTARWESREHRYQLDATLGLDAGRPMAGLGAEYRSQQDDQWMIALSARFSVDLDTHIDLMDATTSAEASARELDSYAQTFPAAAGDALRLAERAWAQLEIAVGTAATRFAEIEQARTGREDTGRLEARLARDVDRVVLAWLRYVEEVDDYLSLVGADWHLDTESRADSQAAESRE